MKDKIYALLTPSARSAFEGFKMEYEDNLLDKAHEIARINSTGESEISLRDVVEARNKISDSNGDYVKIKRGRRFENTILFAGFSYVFLGVLMYFTSNDISRLSFDWLSKNLWMAIIVSGMIFMMIPLMNNMQRILGHKDDQVSGGDFYKINTPEMVVKLWNIIEQKGVNLMKLRGIEINDNSSFTKIYDFLIHEFNSIDNIANINMIIKTRNDIVHQHDISVKKEDIEHILTKEQEILTELDRRIQSYSV